MAFKPTVLATLERGRIPGRRPKGAQAWQMSMDSANHGCPRGPGPAIVRKWPLCPLRHRKPRPMSI